MIRFIYIMPLCVAYIALKSILNINSIKYIGIYIKCLKMAYMSLYEKQKLKYKNQNRKLTTEKITVLYYYIYA